MVDIGESVDVNDEATRDDFARLPMYRVVPTEYVYSTSPTREANDTSLSSEQRRMSQSM